MAGYSQKSLVEKLGIKPNARAAVINPPVNYFEELGPLPDNVLFDKKFTDKYDFIHCFTKDIAEFVQQLPRAKKHLKKDGMIWISWPKKASAMFTDLDENVIRETALNAGLVDVKVCAVDEIWSGLKLVIPLKLRK